MVTKANVVAQPKDRLMSSFPSHPLATISRRGAVQAGFSSLLGLGLPGILSATAQSAPTNRPASSTSDASGNGAAAKNPISGGPQVRRPKSIILVFLTGAASHHDTFDMKPQAPDGIRGDFQPIATKIPGYSICEHLPRLAARADKYAVVRSFSHRDNNHLMSTHYVLTGEWQPGGFFDKVASRTDWPNYAGALAYLRPRSDGIPSGINLPTFLREGPLTWPGQHAGLLGPTYDPWQIASDPNDPKFRVDALTMAAGLTAERIGERQALLREINQQRDELGKLAQTQRLQRDQQLAVSILTSSGLAQAFELDRETAATRDTYGRNTTGQSLLLARRLIEAGVPIVQANIGRVQNWDNHGNIFPTLKDRLLPPLDQGVAALLDDLETRGMLADTFVMMLGEFGRTPKINKDRGRDHWGPCFFGLFAGGGVQPGQLIGRSDEQGAYPATRAFTPEDIGATVYHLLGIPPGTVVQDRLGRELLLNRGNVISPLFDGSEA